MAMTATDEIATPSLPVLVGLRELVELFPSVAEATIYRWNTPRTGAPQLPEPYRRVSRTPMWTEAQIVEFAERKRLVIDQDALSRIRANQQD